VIEEFEYSGVWWIPDNPDRKIPGRLRFNQSEGAILELDGCFTEDPKSTELFNPAIVNGVSNTGKEITLHRCQERGRSVTRPFAEPTYYTSKLYAYEVFVGVHFQREEDIKFNHLRVRYSHLDEWLNFSPFKFEDKEEEKVWRYKPPDRGQVSISDELRLQIAFELSYAWPVTVLHVIHKGVIVIIPAGETHFEKYQQMARRVQDFLSLALGETVYPLDIQGQTESAKWVRGNHTLYEDVKIFYQLPSIPRERRLGVAEPLFKYTDIADKFEQLMQNWFGKAEQLAPVYDLYFGSVYGREMYLSQKFLCLIQALESYHRRMVNNYELPGEDHNKRIQEIINAVPEKHKKWLNGKLEHSNEPTLRKRLNELLDTSSVTASYFIGERKDFVEKMVATRNYHIHYDERLKRKAAKGRDLNDITFVLRILIEMCLLKELGFDTNEVHNLISTRYRGYKI